MLLFMCSILELILTRLFVEIFAMQFLEAPQGLYKFLWTVVVLFVSLLLHIKRSHARVLSLHLMKVDLRKRLSLDEHHSFGTVTRIFIDSFYTLNSTWLSELVAMIY